jgi:hypothetical protein
MTETNQLDIMTDLNEHHHHQKKSSRTWSKHMVVVFLGISEKRKK